MEHEAERVAHGETIDTDVCIIGAGIAGLVVASELVAAGVDVVVLESGTPAPHATAQAPEDGDVFGDGYSLRGTRRRGIGGTAGLWNTPAPGGAGAKYAPLDAWDFEPRWPEAPDGWPFGPDELRPFYARAQSTCALGPHIYESAHWSVARAPLHLGDGQVVSRVYQMGARDALLAPLVAAVRGAPNARLLTGATVVQLSAARPRSTVAVASSDGRRWNVSARRVVLAAGTIENARLLLVAAGSGGGVEDRSGWLGSGFMEHPRDRVLTLTPRDSDTFQTLAFHDAHAAADGTTIVGRFALEAVAARGSDLLNASATLLPIVRPGRERLRARLGAAGRIGALRRWLPAGGHGWSSHPAPARVFDGFVVLLNVEQPPHRENAVRLGSRRDAHGVPLPELHWRWHAEDHARLKRLRAIFARALECAGAGRVAVAPDTAPDPHAHHHAGTTRMHADPRHGVVDADGRVHGTDSLFVAGASTFPTAGFANPTLTIVALSLRLAARLRDER